uniref:SUEL-type lectin domain-containing protein n=1 Tax=Oryzias sinensis TaxID=183150 RepID=A0A8C7XWY6_9TELE
MILSDGTVSPVTFALLSGITFLLIICDLTKGSADLSGYLSTVLKNYTQQACDGEFLYVHCPPRTTITIQSAFYGRRGSSDLSRCPQTYQALLHSHYSPENDRYCSVSTALQKMLDECQDRRSCQALVSSRMFGMDQCPGSSKYLIVWYKCRPSEYKSKVACEEDRMRLSCKQGMQIAIYSAMFGRTQQGTLECPPHHRRAPPVECQSSVALQVLTARCQGKKSCLIRASTREFGDPCYPGIKKYLSVIYTCEKNKFEETEKGKPEEKEGEDPEQSPEMNPIANSTSGANMALFSNTLAAYNYISDHPERAALFFVCGVCLGLFLTLFALVVQISCRTDCQPRERPPAKKRARPADLSSDSSDSDSDWDTTSDLSARRHRRFERTLNMNVFTSAEELERAQRLEERERIIREIWMNGQPDIPGTRSLNRYY